MSKQWIPRYSEWRHGGWYVDNLRYPSGAVGCVSRNYPDGKWRIVCDPRPHHEQPTFRSRDEAARAERDLIVADALRRALPLLERLGDFIGNGEVDLDRHGSLGERCDLILDIKRLLRHEEAASS